MTWKAWVSGRLPKAEVHRGIQYKRINARIGCKNTTDASVLLAYDWFLWDMTLQVR